MKPEDGVPTRTDEMEALPPDMQAGGETVATLPVVRGDSAGIIAMSKNLQELGEAQDRIVKYVLSRAYMGDWIQFGEKLELGGPGSSRIAAQLGMSFTNWNSWREEGEDKHGKWFRWYYSCSATCAGRTLDLIIGRADSRQKFFGVENGQFKAVEDISEADIRIAAWRAAMKEGTKQMFGLRSIPVSQAAELGLDIRKVKEVSFGNSKTSGAAGKASGAKETINAKVTNVGQKTVKGDKVVYVISFDHPKVKKAETWSESIAKAAKGLLEKDVTAIVTSKGRWGWQLDEVDINLDFDGGN